MKYLQAARVQRGLTQKELATRCGFQHSTLSRLETGHREVTLEEAARLAEALRVPLEWFLTGKERPGNSLAELAAELRHLGLMDLLVPHARVPGAFRPNEEVVALAVGAEAPDPRVIEALPALLAWNRWRPSLLVAFAQATHPKALTRLGWLAEITLLIERTSGFPGGVAGANDLTEFLLRVERPHEPDDLGKPGTKSPDHRVWKYWQIKYPADLKTFQKRAEDLLAQKETTRDA